MNFPVVKGWVPFKGSENLTNQSKSLNERNGKLKRARNEDDETTEKVDIPADWKPQPFKLEDNPNKRLFATSEFAVLYPKALDSYLTHIFPLVQKALQEHYVKAEMDKLSSLLTVRTTPKTFDPCIILKAHSVIRVLARFVPVEDSLTLLCDENFEDIISIGHRKKDVFISRRHRVENNEIKELIKEVLDCKIYVSGKSVAVIGPCINLHKVRKIVTECFEKNIHPIYHLKRFQIMNKLAQIPELANEDWTNYLPAIPKKNVKTKRPLKVNVKKAYTPFAPPQTESKKDKELASGVFHLKYEKVGKNYKPINRKKDSEDETPAKKQKTK